MNDQPPKLYRERIEEWEQQSRAAVAQSDADFNNPAWLREALDLEHEALVQARAEIIRLREALAEIAIHCNESKYANYQERIVAIRGIVNGLALWRS